MAVQSYVASEDKNRGRKRQRTHTYTTWSICQFNQDGGFSAFPFVLFKPGTLSPTQIIQWHHHQPPRDQDRTALGREPVLTLRRSWADPWETPRPLWSCGCKGLRDEGSELSIRGGEWGGGRESQKAGASWKKKQMRRKNQREGGRERVSRPKLSFFIPWINVDLVF